MFPKFFCHEEHKKHKKLCFYYEIRGKYFFILHVCNKILKPIFCFLTHI